MKSFDVGILHGFAGSTVSNALPRPEPLRTTEPRGALLVHEPAIAWKAPPEPLQWVVLVPQRLESFGVAILQQVAIALFPRRKGLPGVTGTARWLRQGHPSGMLLQDGNDPRSVVSRAFFIMNSLVGTRTAGRAQDLLVNSREWRGDPQIN